MKDCLLICADVLEGLAGLPDESVQCCLTSPPYWGLRDYGAEGQLGLERTPEEYVERLVAVFEEVRRVLRPDGVLWLNLGSSYAGGTPGSGGNTTKLKPKDLVPIPWMVAMALQAAGWWLRSDVIWAKCLSGGSRLYARTQKGEMPSTLKDLVRLDPSTVQLWNGHRWTQVLSWEPTKRDGDQVEIELRNGERIGCTPNHRWPTSRGLLRADELAVGDIIDSIRLPEPSQPREFMPDSDLGYLVGMYLAEGSMSGATVQIARHADQVDDTRDRLLPLVQSMHGAAVAHRTGGKAATVNLNGPIVVAAIHAYVSGNRAKGKHLSPRAWARSDEFLRAVLNGYLDGDGHWREDAHRWVLGFTANDALAADLRTLCARLGYSLRLRRCVHRNQDGQFPGWRGSLVMEPERRRQPDTEIVKIRRSRARKFWDVTVADDPHTFALASGTLTHNSNPMPESVRDRPTRSHEYVFLLTKSARYFWDQEAVAEEASAATIDRFRYEHQYATRAHRAGATPQTGGIRASAIEPAPTTRNIRSVWTIATQPFPEAHFATFPPALAERCIKAASKEGDTVLDPFCGAGTAGLVALRLNRRFVGIELNPAYCAMARRRIYDDAPLLRAIPAAQSPAPRSSDRAPKPSAHE